MENIKKAGPFFNFFLLFIFFFTTPLFAKELIYRRYLPDNIFSLDPFVSRERYSQSVMLQIFDPLFKTTDGIIVEPHLAKSFTYDEETKTYHIQLRDDVFFHDQIKLTSADVVFTLKRACTSKLGTARILPLIKGCRDDEEFGVKQISDLEVSIKLSQSFPPFISLLSTIELMIMPNGFHGREEKDFFSNPVGTGPFILTSIESQQIKLIRNKNYFLGSPEIKELIYLIEPKEKIYARVTEGTIEDIFPLQPPNEFPDTYEKFFINQAESVFLTMKPNVKPYDNYYFRQAIRSAIHNSEIHNKVSHIEGVIPAHGVIPWGAIGFDTSIPSDRYKPDSVEELIKKAGYQNMALVPELEIRSALKEPLSEIVPNIIQKNLEKFGFKVKVIQRSLPELMTDIQENKIKMMLISPTLTSMDTYHFLEFWKSDFNNPALIVFDQEYDQLLEQALSTSDRFLRAKVYKEANRLLEAKSYVHSIAHIIHRVSLRKKNWNLPQMNFLRPFYFNMHDAIYTYEGEEQ